MIEGMKKSPKTTALGILTLVGALVLAAKSFLAGTPIDVEALTAAFSAGVGLLVAGDAPKAQ